MPPVYVQDMFTLLGELGIARAVLIGTSMAGLMALDHGRLRPADGHRHGAERRRPRTRSEGVGADRVLHRQGHTPSPPGGDAAAAVRAINEVAFPHYDDTDWMAFATRLYHEGPDGGPVSSYDPDIALAFAPPKPDAAAPRRRSTCGRCGTMRRISPALSCAANCRTCWRPIRWRKCSAPIPA
ncbi:MAG: hypothetical protein WDN06_04700 [Asticcacaulis sp.]